MNESMNPQSASGAGTEKTFTQEDVNRIVQERLNKERSRTNSELESSFTQREKELEKREFMMTAKESISRAGLPAELIDVLDKSSPEAFEKALQTIGTLLNSDKSQPRFTKSFSDGVSSNSNSESARIRQAMGLK